MDIKIVKKQEEFFSLKDDWDRLALNLITVNSFDWMFKWWEQYKEEGDLNILVASDNNIIKGIAPLYTKDMNFFKLFKLKKLCFLGGDISDFLDFLINQDEERDLTFKTLLNYAINNLNYDYLGLGQINSHYPNFDLWQKYVDLFKFEFESYRECHKTHLLEYSSYDEYFKKLSKNRQKDLRRIQNKVNNEFERVEYVFERDINQNDIEIIANINISRQKFLYDKGFQDRFCYFVDDRKNNFIKDYFCNSNQNDRMIAYLKCNDNVAAYDLILTNKHTLSFWNGAFDPNYEIYSPAKLLLNEEIKYAFENSFSYFDFMRGNDDYKLHWTNDFSLNYNLWKKKTLKAKIAYLIKYALPTNMLKKFKSLNIKSSLDSGYQG